jgi:hypothetical protein
VDDALESLVALHLQPTGAARSFGRDRQLGIVPRAAQRPGKRHDLGHGPIVGWPPMFAVGHA